MFILCNTDRSGPGIQLRAGRIFEVPTQLGRKLVDDGLADEATAEEFVAQLISRYGPKIEQKVVTPTETRLSRTSRRKKHDRST